MKLPNLIPDWKRAWRFASVQAAVVLALLSGLQAEVLPLVQPLFPAPVWPWVSGALALAVVLLRLVAQPGLVPDSHRAMLERFYEDNETFRRDMQQVQSIKLRSLTPTEPAQAGTRYNKAPDSDVYGPWGLGGGYTGRADSCSSDFSSSGSSSDCSSSDGGGGGGSD